MPKEAHWELKEVDQTVVEQLVTKLNISQLTAEILVRRGFTKAEKAEQFLEFTEQDLHDPYLLLDIEPAVKRIYQAISRQEKIVIYGDYDVDGITSTALLVDYIRSLGGNIDYYIPNRLEEGYGLNQAAIAELAAEGTQLMITVDCGIKAQAEIKEAQRLGIEVIVTDHHTPPEERTAALAAINPHQKDCNYPWADLCGVGVAFKLAQALAYKSELETTDPPLLSYLGLVALGTVADIVPLQGENRVITCYGLKQLNNLETNQQPGLTTLSNVAGFGDKEIKAGNIAYQLAPRINAAGRLGEPEKAVQLLLAENYFTAQELANQLNQFNNHRKEISDRIFQEAEEAIRGFNLEEEWVLVLASPNWHSGVIGNVASDLQEKYHRPVVLIALDEENKGPGSCRSISRFNIYEALKECSDLLITFGGHKQAAGFSITAEKVSDLRERLNQLAKEKLTKDDLRPWQRVDSEVELTELSFSVWEELEALAPFGYQNPRPRLQLSAVEIENFRLVGRNEDHLKVVVSKDGRKIEGIGFGQAEYGEQLQLKPENIDLLCQLDRNEWQGQVNLQLKIKDLKVPEIDFKQRLFNCSLYRRAEESDYDWFYLTLPKPEFDLNLGQELKLTQDAKKIILTANKQQVVEIKTDFAEQLRFYLDVGIEYQAFVVKVRTEKIDVFITRKFPSSLSGLPDYSKLNKKEMIAQIEEEILTTELSVKEKKLANQLFGQDITIEVNSVWNQLPIIKLVCSLQVMNGRKLTVLVAPIKHLAVSYYRALRRSLGQWGLNCRLGTSDLSLREEADLKGGLANEEVEILIATPEFIAEHQPFISQPALLMQEEKSINQDQLKSLNPKRKLEFSLTSKVEEFKSLIQVNDERDRSDRVEYLNSLLREETKALVYVTDSSLSRELAAKLAARDNQVLFYNSELSVEAQNKVINQFHRGEINGLVATNDLLIEKNNITDLVVYQPCLSRHQFYQQVSQLISAKGSSPQVHLLYTESDIEKTEQLIIDQTPNRKLLKELYVLLSKLDKGQSKTNIARQDLYQLWFQQNEYQLKEKTLTIMLGIFAELGLINRIKKLERRIKLSPKPDTKLDLTDSMRYNECVTERQEFVQFTNSVLTATKKEISNFIRGERRELK